MNQSLIFGEIRKLVQERVLTGNSPYALPMSDQQLRECNFFDLYPLDGGGGLFSHSIIPTIDDTEYARCILEKNALEEYGRLPYIDHKHFERWHCIEKGCWVNRFYFIVPLAKYYLLTGDESIARLLVDTILHFATTYPPPSGCEEIVKYHSDIYHSLESAYSIRSFEENQADESEVPFAWFDFQPASRMIHLLYAMYFLKDSPSISPDEWYRMIYLIYQHGEVIYYGESVRNVLIPRNNHQSLRGLALLYAGTYFEGLGLWREFIELGVKIVKFHSRESFASDGSLMENSPSYHAFQTWHVRDAALLSKSFGLNLSPELDEGLVRHKGFIQSVSDPSGMSVVINDGYPVRTSSFLRSLDFVDAGCAVSDTTYFEDAGMASLKNNDLFLFLDASPFTGRVSHYHGGKNAITLWFGGRPFLVDSGCSEYDDEMFSKWYKQSKAHSSLLINGVGDGIVTGIYEFSASGMATCSGWSQIDELVTISSNLTSTSPEWKDVSWNREIQVSPANIVTVRDVIWSTRDTCATLIFNLHPDVVLSKDGPDINLINGDVTLNVVCSGSSPIILEDAEGLCFANFQHHPTRQLLIKAQFRDSVIIETRFSANASPHAIQNTL